jgi:hypothetical protein
LIFPKSSLAAQVQIKRAYSSMNKYNKDSIEWYLRKGFNTVGEAKKDIGGGFFMDDYIMEMMIA